MNREVKTSQRQRVLERNLCADIIISCVLPGFLYVIVVVHDEMCTKCVQKRLLFKCVQKHNENDSDISLSLSLSLS